MAFFQRREGNFGKNVANEGLHWRVPLRDGLQRRRNLFGANQGWLRQGRNFLMMGSRDLVPGIRWW
jgi:hypothetical protein